MKKNIIKLIFLIYILASVFSGCDKEEVPVEAVGLESPTSEIEGYYSQEQIVSGGDGGSALNLADVKIETVDADITKLTLTFGQGSQGEDKSFTASTVTPQYETDFVDGVNRFVLKMEGVSYFSYKIYEDEISNSIFYGMFAQRPVDSDTSYLYVNISTDYAYKVEELSNQIIITFHNVTSSSDNTSYYVTLNAYDEYSEGNLGDEFPLKPTICSDGENILLISQPFDTKTEAQEFITEYKETLETVLEGKKYSLIELSGEELPEFSEETALDEVASSPIGYKDGETLTYSTLITNGRFLCFNDDNSAFVYAQPNTIYGDQEGDSLSFEYLYIEDTQTGLQEKLIDTQFSSITDAQFSYDSKYLAFIDQDDLLRSLKILSLEDGRLYIPADDSFGIDTASFVWDDDENILYAINGEFESKQLLSYDLTNPDDVVVEGVFENEFSESILQIYGDVIYYANRLNESTDGQICSVNIKTGECKDIATGDTFLVSPDGNSIVISDVVTEDEDEIYRLRVLDMSTGEETLIYSGQIISNIAWSYEGTRIYYSVYIVEDRVEGYPYALYYYDMDKGSSVYLMDTITSALYTSNSDDEVLLMSVFTYKSQPLPITYVVK